MDEEDPLVRQYRYLLSTAPVDVIEGIHREVVGDMPRVDREAFGRAVHEAFGTGSHVDASSTDKLAHLAAAGAHRSPRSWLASLDESFSHRLAASALAAEATFGRLNGYVDWDGSSPDATVEPGPNDGFDPNANRHRVEADPRRYASGEGGFGGG